MHDLFQQLQTPHPTASTLSGLAWLRSLDLSQPICPWIQPDSRCWRLAGSAAGGARISRRLSRLQQPQQWQWPERPLLFFTDLHADPAAFVASLLASGAIHSRGPAIEDIVLAPGAEQIDFVIGGDCFDKGPSNLGLLRLLQRLRELGARLTLLAGNHDLRMLLAMRTLGQSHCPRTGHFFIRLGSKGIPFFSELLHTYGHRLCHMTLPDEDSCRRQLLPAPNWPHAFRQAAADTLTPAQISAELERLQQRLQRFMTQAQAAGLSWRDLYAAARLWQDLFLHPEGEFAWFTDALQLLYRRGSFLCVHAGCDDAMALALHAHGDQALNQRFRQTLVEDPLRLYFGPLGNMLRTKYRHRDHPLSATGTHALEQAGIFALVHGHHPQSHGQHLTLRNGLLSFACDTALDIHTRTRLNLPTPGAAATLLLPQGMLLGISNDYPAIKVFTPEQLRDC